VRIRGSQRYLHVLKGNLIDIRKGNGIRCAIRKNQEDIGNGELKPIVDFDLGIRLAKN